MNVCNHFSFSLQVSFKCIKIGSFFNVKDKIATLYRNNAIYLISWGEGGCPDTYIGESKLRVNDRFKKHIHADYYKEYSAIHSHCTTIKHKLPTSESIQILHTNKHWHKRKIMESLFIKKHKPTLNRNVESFVLKLFKF